MATWVRVDPLLQHYGRALLRLGRHFDRSLTLTSGWRSIIEQERLYNAWLERGQTGIPAAVPGTSRHELGLAFDLARPRVDPFGDPLLAYLGKIWRGIGGAWSSSDPVHFQ